MPSAERPYVSVSLSPEARDALREAALRAGGALRRPVSMSEVLAAMADVAWRHEDELTRTLRGES